MNGNCEEKEDTSPCTPIRSKKNKPRESYNAYTHARRQLSSYAKRIPTLEMVLSHCHHRMCFHDDEFVRYWYNQMEFQLWCDRLGNPIKNWAYELSVWIGNRAFFERLRDPDRLPDARTRRKTADRRQPINHLAGSEEFIKDFENGFA